MKQRREAVRSTRERDELVEANKGLAYHFANLEMAYRNRCYKQATDKHMLEDVVQDAMMGLMRAAELYEESEAKFATYAWGWMRTTVFQGGNDRIDYFHVGGKRKKVLRAMIATEGRLHEEMGCKPTFDEVVAAMGEKFMSRECLRDLWFAVPSFVKERSNLEYIDVVEDTKDNAAIIDVLEAVGRLPERNRIAVEQRFGLDGQPARSYAEIGTDPRINLNRETVRLLVNKSLEMIREQLQDE